MMLAPLHLDPEELTANYKPLPQLDVRKKKMVEDIDPLARIMTTKNMRYLPIFIYKIVFKSFIPEAQYFTEQKYTLEISLLFIQKFLNYLIFVSKLLKII